MHYSHDAWEVVPPKQVVEILKKAGVKRAMVSSSNNEGTKMLQDAAPSVIVPELALPVARRAVDLGQGPDDHRLPRRDAGQAQVRGDRRVPHLRRRADLPNMRRVVELARSTGSTYIRTPTPMPWCAISSRIRPPAYCRRIRASSGRRRCARCRRYPTLWSISPFLTAHASNGKVAPGWRGAFLEFPDRFSSSTPTPSHRSPRAISSVDGPRCGRAK